MAVAVQRESRTCRPPVPHRPKHREALQLIEAVSSVNEAQASRVRVHRAPRHYGTRGVIRVAALCQHGVGWLSDGRRGRRRS